MEIMLLFWTVLRALQSKVVWRRKKKKKKGRRGNLERGKVCSFYSVSVTPCCLLQRKIVPLRKKCDLFSKLKSSLVTVCWKIYTDHKMLNVTS